MRPLTREAAALDVARANRACGRSQEQTRDALLLLTNDPDLVAGAVFAAYNLSGDRA